MKLESVGKNIRRFRKERGYRLEDLAEMVGLSANYMGAIERGEKQPSLETFICYCKLPWHLGRLYSC